MTPDWILQGSPHAQDRLGAPGRSSAGEEQSRADSAQLHHLVTKLQLSCAQGHPKSLWWGLLSTPGDPRAAEAQISSFQPCHGDKRLYWIEKLLPSPFFGAVLPLIQLQDLSSPQVPRNNYN